MCTARHANKVQKQSGKQLIEVHRIINQYAVHLSKIAFVKKSWFPLLFHILGNMLGLGELSHLSFAPGDF